MKHLSTAIITLIIGLSVAYYTFILNEKHVDLRYTLSEKIPTKFVGSSATENVQQLVVKNIGNIPAENIQIKINGYIEEYDVLKNLSIDKVEISKSKNYFEAIYASLPPEAQFTFIFKTTGFDISNKNLEIKHNSGRAYEALDNDSRSNLTNTLDTSTSILFLIYLLLILYQFRAFTIDHYKSRGEYENHYDFLNKKRPFYFPQGKWDSIRRDYIKSKRTPNYLRLSDITEGENYKILDHDKPNLASNDEWRLLLTSASKSFTDQLTYLTNTASTYSKIHKLFLLRKPKNLPESNWEEIVNNINETFLTIKKLDSKSLFSKDHFSKELKLEAPQGMIQSYWDKYSDFIRNKYHDFLYTEIICGHHPSNFINETDLSFLTEKQKESIEKLSYKVNYYNIKNITSLYESQKFLKSDKPSWITNHDYENLKDTANAYINLDMSKKNTDALLTTLTHIINLTPLEDKPINLNDKEWTKALKLEKRITTKSIKLDNEKSELKKDIHETKTLKEKILKQLFIIDNLLSHPSSLNKIEDYDNPFSEGNFFNLKKISTILSQINIKKEDKTFNKETSNHNSRDNN